MENARILTTLTDDELLRRLGELLRQSRRVEAELVAHIGEVDARRLYAREAAPSMFAYCTDVLHLSEAEAYLRITVARAAREHPQLLEMLAGGRLHLSGAAKLAPHLTLANRDAVLPRAAHRSKRGIEELVAELAPKPDAATIVRRLPQPCAPATQLRPDGVQPALDADALPSVSTAPAAPSGPAASAAASSVTPPATAVIQRLAPARYKIQFTASAALCRKIERLRALMRSSIPDGDIAAVIEEAVTEKLARLEARRFAKTEAPRRTLEDASTASRSRYIPAAVRRAVYHRDGGRCVYVGETGGRCTERARLEFHHRHPFGFGGGHDPGNIRLMCRTHNAYLAEADYGKQRMTRRPRQGDRVSERREMYGSLSSRQGSPADAP